MGALSRLWALAANTFREAVRDRVLYSILFFAGWYYAGPSDSKEGTMPQDAIEIDFYLDIHL